MAEMKKTGGLIDWLDERLAVRTLVKVIMTEYWIPKHINWLWAMGVVLTMLFSVLVVSGIFLLMYYKPDVKLAFDSVNFTIMSEVEYGWLWRHAHAVSASLIFLVIYIHMFVGIYYGSYKRGREMIWLTGMILFVLFSAEAFSGYMLPWGQMSFWAAKVITDLFAKIPFIGPDLVVWIRGNFIPADATLTRFFMLHVFLLPLCIMALIVTHFYSLRVPHVNNEEGEHLDFDKEVETYKSGAEGKKASKIVAFWPDFLAKDIFVICLFMILLFYLMCFNYNFAMDPINFDPADPMKTPAHIYPEWYFLWSYEVLRGFETEAIGLICFALAQVIFFFFPFLDRSPVVAPAHRRPMFLVWFFILMADLVVLTIFGKLPPEGINNTVGFVAALVFILLFITLPIITSIEKRNLGGGK